MFLFLVGTFMQTEDEKPVRSRNRHFNTSLAYRSRRLGLSLKDVQRLTKEPYGNITNWNQGRRRTPRVVLRMLAMYRLSHWGEF